MELQVQLGAKVLRVIVLSDSDHLARARSVRPLALGAGERPMAKKGRAPPGKSQIVRTKGGVVKSHLPIAGEAPFLMRTRLVSLSTDRCELDLN